MAADGTIGWALSAVWTARNKLPCHVALRLYQQGIQMGALGKKRNIAQGQINGKGPPLVSTVTTPTQTAHTDHSRPS